MNSTAINSPSIDLPSQKRSRLLGLLIMAVIFIPMATAYVIYHTGIGMPIGTTNKGILLTPPQSVKDLALNNGSSQLSDLFQQNNHKKWRMLVPVTKGCDGACQSNLYVSRQVHIRLAEKAYRVERVLVMVDLLPQSEIEKIEQEHPGTVLVSSSEDALQNWLAPSGFNAAVTDYYYLIDQEGFGMMYYGVDHSGQDLLDDLKKLLKFTYDK